MYRLAYRNFGNWESIVVNHTVVLLDRHVAYLDRLAIDIRLKHGRAISRAEIIRGLIEAAFQSGIDLSQADSIDTLVELLTGSMPKRKAVR